jgi:hypothetical protein
MNFRVVHPAPPFDSGKDADPGTTGTIPTATAPSDLPPIANGRSFNVTLRSAFPSGSVGFKFAASRPSAGRRTHRGAGQVQHQHVVRPVDAREIVDENCVARPALPRRRDPGPGVPLEEVDPVGGASARMIPLPRRRLSPSGPILSIQGAAVPRRRRHLALLDVGPERFPVHRSIDDPRGNQPCRPQPDDRAGRLQAACGTTITGRSHRPPAAAVEEHSPRLFDGGVWEIKGSVLATGNAKKPPETLVVEGYERLPVTSGGNLVVHPASPLIPGTAAIPG